MAETRQILTLTLATLLVGIIGLALISYVPALFEGDVEVDEYLAILYPDGTLVEKYTYNVKVSGQFRMLYRIWDDPLSRGRLDRPFIEFLNVSHPQDTIVYLKDSQGSIWVPDTYKTNPTVLGTIRSLAESNEIGIYKPERFSAGKYKVEYVFRIHPPLERTDETCHLNLKYASRHLTYRNVTLIVEGFGKIEAIYPHPPLLHVSKQDSKLVVRGSSTKDELLELEMLLGKDSLKSLDGFPRRFDDVRAPTVQANILYSAQYYMALALRDGTRILALLFPLIFILIYFRYGRERRFVVPRHLSTIPETERKPWLVNLVFKSDALDYDENGLYATILDLHLRKKIKVTPKDGGLIINILNEEGIDTYERRVLDFLKGFSEDGVVDTDHIKTYAENLVSDKSWSKIMKLKEELRYLTREADSKAAKAFMVSGRMRVLPLILLSAILLFFSFIPAFFFTNVASMLVTAGLTSIILLIQSVIALVFPSTLFGKWLGSVYKERLEWESFKRFLSDLALIRKYAPQDISMWGEWLVYGTALGVGDNVVKAMGELKIPLEELKWTSNVPLIIQPVVTASQPSSGGSGGGLGGGGGGFGGGAGFGGGGAGAR